MSSGILTVSDCGAVYGAYRRLRGGAHSSQAIQCTHVPVPRRLHLAW